jgi:hypothetical protein
MRPSQERDCRKRSAGLEVSQLLLNPEFLSLQILENEAIGRRAFLFVGNLLVQIAVLRREFTDATDERHRQSPFVSGPE